MSTAGHTEIPMPLAPFQPESAATNEPPALLISGLGTRYPPNEAR
jgi:hypothetical protein